MLNKPKDTIKNILIEYEMHSSKCERFEAENLVDEFFKYKKEINS
jgi:hypothetical protein